MAQETWIGKHPGHDEEAAVRADNARLRADVERLTRERSEVEANYMKMIAAVLECDPIPAAQRRDDSLEPPWEVISRVRGERDALRALLGQLVGALREIEARSRWPMTPAVHTWITDAAHAALAAAAPYLP